MGVNGDPNVFTPNLDNMAVAGTNFTGAVSGYPLCCPYRATMLTGKYAHNHSVKIHEDRLEPSYATITDVLNGEGYETIYLGKLHLAGFKESGVRSVLRTVPREDRGRFDTWIGYDNNNSQWDCYLHGHGGEEEIEHYRLPGYETDCLTDIALEQIASRADADRPFFMVVSVQPPHPPHLAPEEYRRYQSQQLKLRPNVAGNCEERARFIRWPRCFRAAGTCSSHPWTIRSPRVCARGRPSTGGTGKCETTTWGLSERLSVATTWTASSSTGVGPRHSSETNTAPTLPS